MSPQEIRKRSDRLRDLALEAAKLIRILAEYDHEVQLEINLRQAIIDYDEARTSNLTTEEVSDE